MKYNTRTERRSTVLVKKPNRNIWQCCQLFHPPPCIARRHTRAETVSCEGNGSSLSWPMWHPDWSWVPADGSDHAVRERDLMLLGSTHAEPQDAGWRQWQSAARPTVGLQIPCCKWSTWNPMPVQDMHSRMRVSAWAPCYLRVETDLRQWVPWSKHGIHIQQHL